MSSFFYKVMVLINEKDSRPHGIHHKPEAFNTIQVKFKRDKGFHGEGMPCATDGVTSQCATDGVTSQAHDSTMLRTGSAGQ